MLCVSAVHDPEAGFRIHPGPLIASKVGVFNLLLDQPLWDLGIGHTIRIDPNPDTIEVVESVMSREDLVRELDHIPLPARRRISGMAELPARKVRQVAEVLPRTINREILGVEPKLRAPGPILARVEPALSVLLQPRFRAGRNDSQAASANGCLAFCNRAIACSQLVSPGFWRKSVSVSGYHIKWSPP